MRPAIELEQLRRLIRPVIEDDTNTVGIDDIPVEGVLDGIRELNEGVRLQEPQDANESPRAVPLVGFQPSTEQTETVGQIPLPFSLESDRQSLSRPSSGRAKSKPPGLRSSRAR